MEVDILVVHFGLSKSIVSNTLHPVGLTVTIWIKQTTISFLLNTSWFGLKRKV